MSDNLGTAHGKLTIDGSQAKAELRSVASSADDFKKRTGRAGTEGASSLGHVGKAAAVAGAGIVGALGLAINSAADFEKRLSAISAVSGATSSDMELVRKKALQLGKDTKFSAGEAASAIEELAKAGITLPDILNGAADATVALAAAGEIDLPQAATLAANAMNEFGLKAQELPKVADLIAGAANASAIDVGEFGQSLQQSGAAAHLAGIDFGDLATAIALMGNAGIKGSDAGTSLKTMLLNLNPATKKQHDLMRDLGIITAKGANTFFDAQGKAKSLAQISGILQKALKGQTKQQQLATLETLFGSDAIRAAAVLANAGAKGFDNMSASMAKVKAADVAAKRMDNLKGNIEQLKGSLETVGIVVGTTFLPAVLAIVKPITNALNAFLNLNPEVQKNIGFVLAAAGAFLLAFGAVLKFVEILKIARAAAAAAFLTSPVGLFIAIVLAVVAAVVVLYQRFQAVRNIVKAVFSFAQQQILKLKPTFDTIIGGVRALAAAFRAGGDDITSSGFAGVMEHIGLVARSVVDFIVNVIVPGIRGGIKALAAAFAAGNGDITSSGFAGAMERIGLVARTLFDFFVHTLIPAVRTLVGVIGGAFVTVWHALLSAVQPIVAAFHDNQAAIMTLLSALKVVGIFLLKLVAIIVGVLIVGLYKFALVAIPIVAQAIAVIIKVLAGLIVAIITVIGWVVRIGQVLISTWQMIWSVIGPLVKALGALIGAVFTLAYTIVAFQVKLIFSVVRLYFQLVYSTISFVVNAVRAVITAVWGVIGGLVTGFFRAAYNGIALYVRLALSIVRAHVALIVGAIRGITAIIGIVTNAVRTTASAFSSGFGRVVQFAREIPGRIKSALGSLGGVLIGAGEDMIRGLMQGIRNMAGAAAQAAKDAVSGAVNAVKGLLHIRSPSKVFDEIGRDTLRGYINGVEAMRKKTLETVLDVSGAVPITVSRAVVPPTGAAAAAQMAANAPAITIPTVNTDALAQAVVDGLTGAQFTFGKDGLAKIMANSLSSAVLVGGRR